MHVGDAMPRSSFDRHCSQASALGRLRHPSILGTTSSRSLCLPFAETRTQKWSNLWKRREANSYLPLNQYYRLLNSLFRDPREAHHWWSWTKSKFVTLFKGDDMPLTLQRQIQKGILQICKGLSFLHSSAKLIHTNICPESVIINNAVSLSSEQSHPSYGCSRLFTIQGDWKVTGLGLTIPLLQTDGTPTRWEFPTFDGRVPSYIQRSFDYMGACRWSHFRQDLF